MVSFSLFQSIQYSNAIYVNIHNDHRGRGHQGLHINIALFIPLHTTSSQPLTKYMHIIKFVSHLKCSNSNSVFDNMVRSLCFRLELYTSVADISSVEANSG